MKQYLNYTWKVWLTTLIQQALLWFAFFTPGDHVWWLLWTATALTAVSFIGINVLYFYYKRNNE